MGDFIDLSTVSNWIGLSAALGTAAMGFVEACKWTRLGLFGLGKIDDALGPEGRAVLEQAYGSQGIGALLAGSYRRGSQELAEVLRNGLRVGLTSSNAADLARRFGQDQERVRAAVALLHSGQPLPQGGPEAGAIARMHLAIDARVDGAVAAASEVYVGSLRIAATIFALIGTLVAFGIQNGYAWNSIMSPEFWEAIVIAAVAVPIAPIAKDLVNALKAATDALCRRS